MPVCHRSTSRGRSMALRAIILCLAADLPLRPAAGQQRLAPVARFPPVVAPLRTRMIYSNVGYTVGGEAAAAGAGLPFETMLRDLVIKPLHLPSTTWSYEQAGRMPNVASPHVTLAGRQQPIRRE